MKTKIILTAVIALLLAACQNNNVYSDLLKAERQLIESYIQRQGIQVLDTLPAHDEWEEKVYYRVPEADNFYFHLVAIGDTTLNEVKTGDLVSIRFKRYTLNEYADTLYNWTTQDSPNPIKFAYHPNYNMVTSDQTCKGWLLAVKYMKYPKAQCKIICPSKFGFSEENSSVTPYGYDIKRTDLQIK